MIKDLLISFFILFSSYTVSQQAPSSDFPFQENKGQIIDQNGNQNTAVKYLFTSPGLNVQLRKNGFSYDVYERTIAKKSGQDDRTAGKEVIFGNAKDAGKKRFHRVDIDFINANANPKILVEGKSADYDNYHNFSDNVRTVEKVYRYKKLTYKNLYPHVDLVFFQPDDSLKTIEYNFIIHPGGRISDIQFEIKGAKTRLKKGKIAMKMLFGEMEEEIPQSWTENISGKQALDVTFKETGKNRYAFASDIDTSEQKIVIDPVPTRIWGSYLGGNGEEFGKIRADKYNNIYFHGWTGSSNNIATAGAYQNNLKAVDAFVIKIDKNGKKIWGTYYGRPYFDDAGSLDFDEESNVYIGITSQKPNPRYPGNRYYFHQKFTLLILSENGSFKNIYEYGSEAGNEAYGAYQDEAHITDVKYYNGKIYFVGDTVVENLGTPGAFQENKMMYTAGFLLKFDAVTAAPEYFTYLTGNHGTKVQNIISINDSGIELLGTSSSTDFPQIRPFQPLKTQKKLTGIYAKFNLSGSLLRSSYLGNDTSTYRFLHGRRFGDTLLLGGRIEDRFAFCYYLINTNTNTIESYKEVNVINNAGIIYIDDQKNIFVTGRADADHPRLLTVTTPNAYMPAHNGSANIFLTKYDLDFNKIWSTFYAGNGGTQIGLLAQDNEGYLYLTGMSSRNTAGIATPGAFQQTTDYRTNDQFIVKFADCESVVNISASPTCIGQNLQLFASGGSTYEWTGPNGFKSYEQNPTIINAQANDSGEYFVRMTGGQSCGGIFSVRVHVGNTRPLQLDNLSLPDIEAFCTVVVSTTPTATTGCGIKVYGVTNDSLIYTTPGTYLITWTYTDLDGTSLSQKQKVIVKEIDKPIRDRNTTFCKSTNPTIKDIAIIGTDIKWYDATGNILDQNTALIDGTSYFATQTVDGCESAKVEITVTVSDPAPPAGNAEQEFCAAQNPTVANLQATGQNLIWYNTAGSIFSPDTPLVDGQVYFGTQTVNGCESSRKLAVKVAVTDGGIPATNADVNLCSDNLRGNKIVNLNEYKNNLISNTAGLIFEFFDVSNQPVLHPSNTPLPVGTTVFNVKISNSLGCFVQKTLSLILNPKPELVIDTAKEFCLGQSAELDAGEGFAAYVWTLKGSPAPLSTSQYLTVTKAGIYTIEVKNIFGCSSNSDVVVSYAAQPSIIRVDVSNNTARVVLSETGSFLYSLDNHTWQTNDTFSGLSNGNYTAYVKTSGDCIIGQINFSLFNISNSFTPNADGINDTWKIDGIENYPGSEVHVYDRYGNKVFFKIVNNNFEWDGTFGGRPLPTASYWYSIKISDGRQFTGWLHLTNR